MIPRTIARTLSPLFACAALALSVASCSAATGEAGDASGAAHPLLGKPAPELTAEAVGGDGPKTLKAAQGKVVILDFWGTFCEPCKKSFPKLEELNHKYASSGLRIIGVSEDEDEDKDKIPGFAKTYGATFTLAWDGDKAVARRYKPETMPSSFVIDKDGVVRFAHVGFHDGEEVAVESEVRDLLGMK
jgi:cytochrome c biogenesis protein CcmG/thiol:disulfide interchange protein DsbE